MKWLKLVPAPRKRPEASGPFADAPIEWDVFISYRSSNRAWAIALYDQLVAAGYKVFLDQFVLRPGLKLEDSLDDHLSRSASGVLVYSHDVAGSDWVASERQKMQELVKERARTPLPFHFIIARLDDTPLPFKAQGAMYADFSSGFEDGPRGTELVRLIHGLVGAPVPDAAVRELFQLDQDATELQLEIATAAKNREPDQILQLMSSRRPVLDESPAFAALAAQALISARAELQALDVIHAARKTFPRSLRLQQLEGLALRRLERIEEAQKVLGKLYVGGHRDPETMGIYAATWMLRYVRSGQRADLERSRTLYLDAFELSPRDEYVGINAASKTALLGELALARELAQRVEALVARFDDGADFYKCLSLAEARLLLGNYAEAARIYRATRVRNDERVGDLAGTRRQLEALIAALAVPSDAANALRNALEPA